MAAYTFALPSPHRRRGKALVESEDWEGPAYDTCKWAGSICKTFARANIPELGKPVRRETATFRHHAEAASLPTAEADRVLDWCEEALTKSGRLPTIKATREKVKQIKAWLAQGWTQSQLERRQLVEKGITVVASKRNDDTGKPIDNALIAWADQQGLMLPIDRNTPWGNPFETPADGSRDEVCDNYANHYLPHKPSLLKHLPTLKGKVLMCWCHPLRCHGDHLAELANR